MEQNFDLVNRDVCWELSLKRETRLSVMKHRIKPDHFYKVTG